MATKTGTGSKYETWLSPNLAADLKRQAEHERRSVSAVIRLAIEDRLRAQERRR